MVKQYTDETDPSKIREMAENGMALEDTFGMDLSESIRGVDALIENMGLTSEEAFDYMARGAQNGLDKSGELADNLAEYSQIWAQAGFSAEETADLMPTATTIQYRSDLFENEKPTVVEEKKGYSLTAKGKLLMAVYALVVAVVLALIIINTSVLKTLDSEVNAQEARLSEVTAMSRELDDRIAEYTSDEYIINWAEENGFVHR